MAAPAVMAAERAAKSELKADAALSSWAWLVIAVPVARSTMAAGVTASLSTGVGVARMAAKKLARTAARMIRDGVVNTMVR